MASNSAPRKRGRQEDKEEAQEKRSQTRSQSKKSRQINPPVVARSLEREVEEIVCEEEGEATMSQKEDGTFNAANIQTLPDMALLLRSELQKMPSKEYIEQKIGTVDRRSRKNEEAILQLRNSMADLGRRMKLSISEGRGPGRQPNEIAYDLALRQLRMWPLKPDAKSVDDFLKGALLINDEDNQNIIYEQIERIPSLPRARQHNEIRITFKTPTMKDIVLSYVRNLSTYVDKDGNPTAGIRLEIPQFLTRIHRNLDAYGYYLRQKHGRATRRIIKFDPPEMSLYLAYKLTSEDSWK